MQGLAPTMQTFNAWLPRPCRGAGLMTRQPLRSQPPLAVLFKQQAPVRAAMSLLVAGLCVASVQSTPTQSHGPQNAAHKSLVPGLAHSGYLPVVPEDGSKLFYMFYEAQEGGHAAEAPIVLWLQVGLYPPVILSCSAPVQLHIILAVLILKKLQEQHTPMRFTCPLLPNATVKHIASHRASCATQGGPGASALLGNFYELGPYQLTEDLERRENPGKRLSGRCSSASLWSVLVIAESNYQAGAYWLTCSLCSSGTV